MTQQNLFDDPPQPKKTVEHMHQIVYCAVCSKSFCSKCTDHCPDGHSQSLRQAIANAKKLSIDERFELWIKENPTVVELYLRFAREAMSTGREHYGIKAITERIRWHIRVDTKTDDFKINDHFSAPMARLLVKLDPSLRGLFEERRRPAAGKKNGQ